MDELALTGCDKDVFAIIFAQSKLSGSLSVRCSLSVFEQKCGWSRGSVLESLRHLAEMELIEIRNKGTPNQMYDLKAVIPDKDGKPSYADTQKALKNATQFYPVYQLYVTELHLKRSEKDLFAFLFCEFRYRKAKTLKYTVRFLARKLLMSQGTTQRALMALVEKSLLTIVKRAGGRSTYSLLNIIPGQDDLPSTNPNVPKNSWSVLVHGCTNTDQNSCTNTDRKRSVLVRKRSEMVHIKVDNKKLNKIKFSKNESFTERSAKRRSRNGRYPDAGDPSAGNFG